MSNLYRGPSIWCFLPSFGSFGQAVSEEKIFLEIDQSETRISCGGHVCLWIESIWAIFIEDLPRMPPTKFRFIWSSGFRREDFFRNQPIRNKNCLWWPCLITDLNEMSNLHRCFLPSFGSLGQAVSEEKIFLKTANQKQELPVAAMFVNGS